MIPDGALPGFVATNGLISETHPSATIVECGPAKLAYWGVTPLVDRPPVLALSRVIRTNSGKVSEQQLIDGMNSGPSLLTALLPPFAAVEATATGVRMFADSMGFRQLYHTDPDTPGQGVMSTSALSIAEEKSCQLDETAVAVQSLLGWQLGQRTLFSRVSKLSPGSIATVSGDGIELTEPDPAHESDELALSDAVRATASLLRESLGALLDDHPDAVLQLSGGQDSRILLSAIPLARRRGLRAMTLGGPGSGDVEVARQIASRYGLSHEVHDFSGVEHLDPFEAWDLVRSAAVRLDAMSDPIGLAALAVAEKSFDQGVRISGAGGEAGRGFYYLGRVSDRTYTRRDAERLASWRMFVNDAVEPGMLTSDFSEWARQAASSEVYAALLAGGPEWFRATDHLYINHRIQRWAGVADTAVAYQRVVINPLLDHGYMTIVSRLRPSSKANSRFFARVQMELDPELGHLPLEGRPTPASYAHPSTRTAVAGAYGNASRLLRKLIQRARHTNRPPVGSDLLASKVVSYWRENPETLTNWLRPDVVSEEWVSELIARKLDPRPSSVALLTNLVVASQASNIPKPGPSGGRGTIA